MEGILINILEVFYPRRYEVSTHVIPSDYCHARRMQGVILDTDSTLVPHDAPAGGQAVEPFEWLHTVGMEACPLSNGKESGVKPSTDFVGSCYIHRADEPRVKGYEKIVKPIGTDREHTLFVRDQLSTDMYGTSRADLYSILVRPMSPGEGIQIVMKCYLEKSVLHFYKKHARDINRYGE